MIVKHLKEIQNSSLDVEWGNGKSKRLLIKSDGVGFTITDTLIYANTESSLHYQNHIEACYCIEGSGEIEVGEKIINIHSGSLYVLDKNEPHILRAHTDMRLICVFTPALEGDEKHNLNSGGYSSY